MFADRMKKSLLQAAIKGRLTEQLLTDGDARDLLRRIRAEKTKLITAKKIKAEKPLPTVTDDEIPFDIPDSWCWCRLNDLYNFIDYRGKTPTKISTGIPLITAKNVKFGYNDYSIREYISEDEFLNRQRIRANSFNVTNVYQLCNCLFIWNENAASRYNGRTACIIPVAATR